MIQIKNAKELDGMRKANALSAAALKYGGEHIEAGMTTWELDKLIYDFIVKHGGIPNFKGLYGFPGTACISLNDTIIHGIPSHDIVIRPGDIVSIDTGAKVDGFNGDNACTYAVGRDFPFVGNTRPPTPHPALRGHLPPRGKARSASRRCVKFSENRKFENTRKQEHLREFESKHSIN